MEEIWKDIKEYEGLYQISNLGRVKSLKRNCILKISSGRKYKGANLYKEGITKTKAIHRLVADAFIPNPNNYPCVNHIDTNIENNKADNLEWCSYIQNNNYKNHNLKKHISSVIYYLKRDYSNKTKLIKSAEQLKDEINNL